MSAWPYAWVLTLTVNTIAIAVSVLIQGYIKTGSILIGVASLILLVVAVKEKTDAFGRLNAYYSVHNDRVSYQFTLEEFNQLPLVTRTRLLEDQYLSAWRDAETTRHGEQVARDFFGWSRGLAFRIREWFKALLRR